MLHLRGKGELAPSEHVFYSAVGKVGGDSVGWEGRKVLTIRTTWDLTHWVRKGGWSEMFKAIWRKVTLDNQCRRSG